MRTKPLSETRQSGWDEQTLAACRRGERAALERVLDAESPAIERTLSRIVGSRADVEDVLQKTMLAAIEAFPRFRGEASVRTWLTSIAIRLAQVEVRKPARARKLELVVASEPHADAGATDHAVDERRLRERVREHLASLDAKKRVALALHVVEGRSIEEVAALVGVSQATVKSRLFFGRRQLMKRMKRDPTLRELFELQGARR